MGEIVGYWKALVGIGVLMAVLLHPERLDALMRWFTSMLARVFALGGG